MNITAGQQDLRKVSQDSIAELRDFIQDEEIRKRQLGIEKLESRNKLFDEAQKVFRVIRKTIYLERKQIKLAVEDIMVCSCKPPQEITTGEYAGLLTVACGRRCLNRVVNTECCAILCVAGDRCTNRRFQLQQHSQVYPIKTLNRGWGLAAGQCLRKGQFIIQYIGEVYNINSNLGRGRLLRYMSSKSTYLMSVNNNEVIDPTSKGNLARFINHSCDPNCETQKWNVMGETVIGIFAKRDILEDEELTFDYKFDTHKTWFTECFCGADNCRKYLGLVKLEDKDKYLSDVGVYCKICKISIDDRDGLVMCCKCNVSCHMNCIQTKGKSEAITEWVCGKCRKKESNAVMKEENRNEKVIKMEKYKFDHVKMFFADIRNEDVQLYWDVPLENSLISLHIRGLQAEDTANKINELLQSNDIQEAKEDSIITIEIKIQKLLSVQAYKFLMANAGQVRVEKAEGLDIEKVLPLNQLFSFYLTGRSRSVDGLAKTLMDYIDRLVVSTTFISQAEARELESDLYQFKNMVYPVEVRISHDKTIISSTHPFFSHSYEERKLVFIGTEENIQTAYRIFNSLLGQRLNNERQLAFNFLLPMQYRVRVKSFKTVVVENLKKMTVKTQPFIHLFEPSMGKKHLTVSVVATWQQILEGKNAILKDLKEMYDDGEFNLFFSFVYSQIYRSVLRGVVKYVHEHEKLTSSQVEVDGKRVLQMKFWDLYSVELFLVGEKDNFGILREEILKHLGKNNEIISIMIRLAGSLQEVERVLKIFELSQVQVAQRFVEFAESYSNRPHNKTFKYNDSFITAIENFEIEKETELNRDVTDIPSRVVELCRLIRNKQKFLLFPSSFGSEVEAEDWEPEIKSNLSVYLENLNKREIILGTEHEGNHPVSHYPVLFDAKEKADLMVGSYKDHKNILYVIFADDDN